MAKYDREFLVPYLQDICSLYLAERKLKTNSDKMLRDIAKLSYRVSVEHPEEPRYASHWDGVTSLVLLLGLFLAGGSLLGIVSGGAPGEFAAIAVMGIIIGVAMLFYVDSAVTATKKNNEYLREEYEAELSEYARLSELAKRQNEEAQDMIVTLQAKMEQNDAERKRIAEVMNKIYGVNVIPSHYRNMYAAVYLYDYFSTSRANDLDMALNTFVLEQIKDKLDIIIERQQEMILNQRMIIANQRQEIEEQRKHNAYMRRRACEIAANTEEQNQYLAMIESNTAASAYFAAANYLK